MTSDPARDFAEKAQREYERFVKESQDIDRAFLQGRVGKLVKKYAKELGLHDEDEDDDGDSTEPAAE